MKVLLIMNPGSRSGRGKRRWRIWQEGLRKAGIRFECAETTSPGHAFKIASKPGDCDLIVAVGGDGTINEVLDGVIQSEKPDLCVGILYSGTSPDFCRFHRIPTDPQKALTALIKGQRRQVDVAKIIYSNCSGSQCVSHFGCSCNIGMGANIAGYSNLIRRITGDTLGTALAVMRTILTTPPVDLELEIDGETYMLHKTNNLAVVKNPYLASGLKLNLNLQPDDGRMVLFGLYGKSRLGICKTLPGFYTGNITSSSSIFMKDCTSVMIRSENKQEIEFDGDPRGFLPVRIAILPKALNLIGPCHYHD